MDVLGASNEGLNQLENVTGGTGSRRVLSGGEPSDLSTLARSGLTYNMTHGSMRWLQG